MQTAMTTFLVRCDAEGQLLEVFWHQPATLLSPFQRNLSDLFLAADQKRISDLLHASLQTTEVLSCHKALRLRSPQTAVSLCSVSSGDQVLLMGMDAELQDRETTREQLRFIVHAFMKVIAASSTDLSGKGDMTVRLQFEQIQMLNNQLINAQRQLSRLNAEMARLNNDLNSRLVKDELTGLVSRYQYRAEMERHIREQPDKLGIFAFIDIDHFKGINDTYGHQAGDTFLQVFAARMQTIPYENKICMRISGDEFGLYLHGYSTVDDVDIARVWQEIEAKILSTPADIGPLPVPIRCSAGMSVFGVDTREIYELIAYADHAMYRAKNHGKNTYQRFDIHQYRKDKRK